MLAPLKLGKYFVRNGFRDVNEMDWYEEIKINDLKVTLVPAVHWSKEVCGTQIKLYGVLYN